MLKSCHHNVITMHCLGVAESVSQSPMMTLVVLLTTREMCNNLNHANDFSSFKVFIVPINMALTEPTKQETVALFEELESSFPSRSLGEDKWQILAVTLNYHLQYCGLQT